ncbi:MAG: glycosyl hydrolase 108 family protein [Thermodesulfovibrionales bacterium]
MIDKLRPIEQTNANYVGSNQVSKRKFHQVLNEAIEVASLPTQNTPNFTPLRDNKNVFEEMMKIVLKHEGTKVVKDDGGRETSKFGILQSTAREFGYTEDITKLTKDDAVKIYKKLWDKSGAGSLPYPLSLVHFDTYINSPSAARRILRQSDGDVDTYLSLREARFKRLAELRPERFAKYLKGWLNRVENLRTIVKEHRESQYLALNPDINLNNQSPLRTNKALL